MQNKCRILTVNRPENHLSFESVNVTNTFIENSLLQILFKQTLVSCYKLNGFHVREFTSFKDSSRVSHTFVKHTKNNFNRLTLQHS